MNNHQPIPYPFLIFLLLLLFSTTSSSQSTDLNQTGFFQYQSVPLKMVLVNMERDFRLSFAYSPNLVSLQTPVTLKLKNAPIRQAFDALYEQTGVTFTPMGRLIVLKSDPQWGNRINWNENQRLPERTPIVVPDPLDASGIGYISREGGDSYGSINLALPALIFSQAEEEVRHKEVAQLSILPYIGIDAAKSIEQTNNLSVNLLWGISGGVDGVEIGGIANSVIHDMTGTQIAGGFNVVGGKVDGLQLAGLVNLNLGETRASQLSGLFNFSGQNSEGLQCSGLGNLVNGNFKGVQLAGAFNSIGGHGQEASQLAPGVNYAQGRVKLQMAGLFNKCDTISDAQIAALFNRAKIVEGIQLGLINKADTVEGISIGLLNLVKKGYKKTALGVDELGMISLSRKIGTNRFYNIFQFAVHAEAKTWALGYGFGTAFRPERRFSQSLEISCRHFNQQTWWYPGINLQTQLRLLAQWKMTKRLHLAAGPSLNLFITDRRAEGDFAFPALPFKSMAAFEGASRGIRSWAGFQMEFNF